MSKLVDMIEALQEKWADPEFWKDKGCRMDSSDCADDLAPILAAARAQAEELALANFRRDTWNKQCEARDEIIDALKQELVAMKEQHSADLREIAEMAIKACAPTCPHCKNGLPIKSLEGMEHGHWTGVTFDGHTLPSGEHVACLKRKLPTADSIVREFREQKAKVGK